MIRNVLCSIGLTVLALALWGHTPGTGGSDSATLQPRILIQQANPWTRLNWNDDPARFQFAIVADRTGGHRPGVFAEAIGKLNLLQPEFVMSVGDLIEGYSEDRPLLQSQWAEIEGFVGQLGMPFFYVPGNHDLSNPVQVEEWKQRFGRLYYHFVYKDVLFLCLDSEDPPDTHISAAQIEYAAQALQENPDVRWTLVFLHKPLWIYQQDTGWQPIEDLLADRPHTVFAGHYHTYTRHERHDTMDFWSPRQVRQWLVPRLCAEIDVMRSNGAAVTYTVCTGIMPMLDILTELEFDAYNAIEPVLTGQDMERVARELGPRHAIWGGVSGPIHIGEGTPEIARQAVRDAFWLFGKHGLILNAVPSIRAHWPWENALAMFAEWRALR